MGSQNNKNNYRTIVLILLTLVYSFNFIDRQIVGILAPFIQKDLGLTNTQLGLLTGFYFALFYLSSFSHCPFYLFIINFDITIWKFLINFI